MTQELESTEPRNDALRVVIVDDHDLFRTGLRNLLEEQGIVVVGEAAAGATPFGRSASSPPTSS